MLRCICPCPSWPAHGLLSACPFKIINHVSIKETIENLSCCARNHAALGSDAQPHARITVHTSAGAVLVLEHHLLERVQSPCHMEAKGPMAESEAKRVTSISGSEGGLRGVGRAGIQHSSHRSSSDYGAAAREKEANRKQGESQKIQLC